MNGKSVYDVPLIPTDLRPEETIHQICDALNYLKSVSNDVFDRISNKITDNNDKLKSINTRITVAQAKVDALKGSNKATKVFSSAKYPNQTDDSSYSKVYNSGDLPKLQRGHHKVQSKHAQVNDNILKEKLRGFDTPMHLDIGVKLDPSNGEGLGRLPQNIPSVSSLLLFNTSENPYKKYVILDPLGVVTKTRKEEDVEEGLADAPKTILQREELDRLATENYSYMPGIGVVPEIAVPDFLPDLVGIADDLSYNAELGPSIAPSVPVGTLPELPEFTQEEVLPSGPLSQASSVAAPPMPGQGPPAPPPPPPPPPPPVAPPPPPPQAPPPPPQAPPPPPQAPPPPTVTKSDKDDQSKSTPAPEVPGADTGRAGLLDAIRKAGGAGKAKLKSVKERKQAAKKQKQEQKDQSSAAVSVSSGGDLMSDLSAKLLLRRKGISGTGKPGDKANSGENRDSGGSAMDRISAMIPPPSEKSSRDEQEDWG